MSSGEGGADLSRPLRCVIFDFDGVLVLSNAAKRRAYFTIFAPHGAVAADIEAVLADPRFVDRHDVIGGVLARIRPGQHDEALAAALVAQYGRLCLEAQGHGPERAGASALLARWSSQLGLYLNSATPELPLQEAVGARRWNGYFRGVFGRPADKVRNIARALEAEGVTAAEAVMVGDGRGDREAAARAGCRFIAVESDGNDFLGPLPMVRELAELDGMFRDLSAPGAVAGAGGIHAG
jgi:phosphoglycolate phosphatase